MLSTHNPYFEEVTNCSVCFGYRWALHYSRERTKSAFTTSSGHKFTAKTSNTAARGVTPDGPGRVKAGELLSMFIERLLNWAGMIGINEY